MKNFEELQSLWTSQPAGKHGTAHEAVLQARKYEKSLARRLFFNILALGTTVVFLIIIWNSYRFESILTHIGLTIVVLTVSVFAFVFLREYLYLRHDRTVLDSIEYLSHLKTYYRKRKAIARAVETVYTTFLSVGILLYMYSLIRSAPLWAQVLAYGLTIGWIIIATVWGHFKFKKQQQKLEENIVKLEAMMEKMGGE